jgi:hypothetical protein
LLPPTNPLSVLDKAILDALGIYLAEAVPGSQNAHLTSMGTSYVLLSCEHPLRLETFHTGELQSEAE